MSEGSENIQEFDVHVDTPAQGEAPKISGMFGSQAAIERRAREEGATIVDIPLGTDPAAAFPTKISIERLGSICWTIMQEADKFRGMYPNAPCDHIRAMIIAAHIDIDRIGFFRDYPTLFMTFSDKTIPVEQKMKALQTIKLKGMLERRQVTGEQANSMIGTLMGSSEEKRRELYEKLRQIHEEEKKLRQKNRGSDLG